MYLKKIILENIRCFKKQIIDFDQKGSSIIISGDNGDGKSTLLRSISMGLTDETSASALLRELPGNIVRKGEYKGVIKIFLGDQKIDYEIETTIHSLKEFEKVEQKLFPYKNNKRSPEIPRERIEDFPWEKIFVCGYGAGVRTNGTVDYQYYTSVDAVYPLFRYDTPLQSPELAIRRIIDSARTKGEKSNSKAKHYAEEMEKHLMDLLSELLNLGESEEFILSDIGIEIKTKKWGKNELGAMGDGYQATITWVIDLLSWWMLYLGLTPRKNIYHHREIKGIVLIDELEQHLHPRWQKSIIKTLREKFPKIQFIICTHSPLIISGAEDTTVYAPQNGEFIPKIAEGWLAEDVLTEVMGIRSSRPQRMENMIQEYQNVTLKKLKGNATLSDKRKYNELKQKLSKLGPTDPISITSHLKAIIDKIKNKS